MTLVLVLWRNTFYGYQTFCEIDYEFNAKWENQADVYRKGVRSSRLELNWVVGLQTRIYYFKY